MKRCENKRSLYLINVSYFQVFMSLPSYSSTDVKIILWYHSFVLNVPFGFQSYSDIVLKDPSHNFSPSSSVLFTFLIHPLSPTTCQRKQFLRTIQGLETHERTFKIQCIFCSISGLLSCAIKLGIVLRLHLNVGSISFVVINNICPHCIHFTISNLSCYFNLFSVKIISFSFLPYTNKYDLLNWH